MVSDIFNPEKWDEVEGFNLRDITYHRAKNQGTVRIAFNRPEVRNAFAPTRWTNCTARLTMPA